MSKQNLGKGLNSLLDEIKPVTSPAMDEAGGKNIVLNTNGIATEKVKSNGLKVLLTSNGGAPPPPSESDSSHRPFLKTASGRVEKRHKFPFLLLISADVMLVCLAFWIILKSKETPSVTELILSAVAIGVGALLVCWGVWEIKKTD